MPKKIPQRMCLGCREHKNKTDMVRIVCSPDGEISVDLTGRKNGRGAYICPKAECLKKAGRQKALENALHCEISSEVLSQLLLQLEEAID